MLNRGRPTVAPGFARTLLALSALSTLLMGVDHCSPVGTCLGTYELGERFPASDRCNTCICQTDGFFTCTQEDWPDLRFLKTREQVH